MGIHNVKRENATSNGSNRQFYVRVLNNTGELLGWEVHTPLEEVYGYPKLIDLAKSLGAHSIGEDTYITWFMSFENKAECPTGTDNTDKLYAPTFICKEAAAGHIIKKGICNIVRSFLRLSDEMQFDTIVGSDHVSYKRGTLFNETEGYEIFADKDKKFMVDSTSKFNAFVMVSLTDYDNKKTRTVRVELDRKSKAGNKIQVERKVNMFNTTDSLNCYVKTMINLAGAFFGKLKDALDGFDMLNGVVITGMGVCNGKTLNVSKPKLSDFYVRVTVISNRNNIGNSNDIKATKLPKIVKLTGIDTLIAEPEEKSADYVAMENKLMEKLCDAYDYRVNAGVISDAAGEHKTKLKSTDNGSVVLTGYDAELFSQVTDIY